MENRGNRMRARGLFALCVGLLLLLGGCGGQTGGFPSGLGGGLVNGAKRSVFILFGASPASGPAAHRSNMLASSRAQVGGTPIPLLPPIGATKAYVGIQGAGYQGSDISFKPVIFANNPLMTYSAAVTVAANSTVQTLDNLTGLAAGTWLQFIPSGSDDGLRIITAVNGASVTLSATISTTVGERVTAGKYIEQKVPTGTKDIDDPNDTGDFARLFNMGTTRRIFVEYQDDTGHGLGFATFTIKPDPTTGASPTLYLNQADRVADAQPDLTAHEGRLVRLPIDVQNLPLVTPAAVGLGPSVDLAKSIVFTISETGTAGDGLAPNTFTQVLNTQLSDYTDVRTLKEQGVLVADRGFPFQLVVEAHAGSDGQGALVAWTGGDSSGNPSPIDLGVLPLQVQPQNVSLQRSPGLLLATTTSPFLLTVGQVSPITAILVDVNGNQSAFKFPGQTLKTVLQDPVPILAPQNARALTYQIIASGLASVTLTLRAEPDQSDPYFCSTGPVPIQSFSNTYTLVISNYQVNPITISRTIDTSIPFAHLDLALVNQDGSSFPLPRPFNVDSWYTSFNSHVTIQATADLTGDTTKPNLTDRRPRWLAAEGQVDSAGRTTSDSQLIFRAIGVSISPSNPNYSSANVLDKDLPLTIVYTGFGAPTEIDIPVNLHAIGGSAGGGVH